MKADEQRLAELERLLNGHQLEPFRARLAVVSPQVEKKQAEVSQFRSRAEGDMRLSQLRQGSESSFPRSKQVESKSS
jgi:hypothetical protein